MNYVCTDARFFFWDGKNMYTVEYAYALKKWFVFDNRSQSDALYQKEELLDFPFYDANSFTAGDILCQYLQTLKK